MQNNSKLFFYAGGKVNVLIVKKKTASFGEAVRQLTKINLCKRVYSDVYTENSVVLSGF